MGSEKQLNCPLCGTEMGALELISGEKVTICQQCRGSWYSRQALRSEAGLSDLDGWSLQLKGQAELSCPKCISDSLTHVEVYGAVSTLTCQKCGGFWLSQGQLEDFEKNRPRRQILKKVRAQKSGFQQPQIDDRFKLLDPELPKTLNLLGPLVLWSIGIALAFSPLSLILQWSVNIRFHELGHALCAWLDSRPATPLGLILPVLAWTSYGNPSWSAGFFILFLLGVGFYRSYQGRSIFLVSTFALLICLWFFITVFIGNKTAQMMMTWSGMGGEFILSAWCLLAFSFYFPEKLRWPFCRWVFGLLGSFGFFFSCRKWFEIYWNKSPLPLGTAMGGSGDSGGDLNKLMNDHLWTKEEITLSYVKIAFACIALLVISQLFIAIIKRRSSS